MEPVEPSPEVVAPENAEVADTQPEPVTEPVAEAAPVSDVSLLSMLLEEFDTENPALDEAAHGLTAAEIRELPPKAQIAIRAALRGVKAKDAKDAELVAKRDEGYKKREEAINARAAQVERQRLTLLAMAAKAKDPGKAPEADPMTPDGQRAIAEHNARKAVAEAFAPLNEERENALRDQEWAEFVERHPALRDQKAVDAAQAFFEKENEGIDLAKQAPRVPWQQAFRLYLAERNADATRTEAARVASVRVAERAKSAAAIGRSSGAPTANIGDRLAKMSSDEFEAYVAENPNSPAVRDYMRRELESTHRIH